MVLAFHLVCPYVIVCQPNTPKTEKPPKAKDKMRAPSTDSTNLANLIIPLFITSNYHTLFNCDYVDVGTKCSESTWEHESHSQVKMQ